MSKQPQPASDQAENNAGWDATTVLVLVGMIALAIVIGLLVT